MALSIDSEALLYLKRILNMPGAGSSETILEDGSVTQVLDILTIARRSLTPVESSGMFIGVLVNAHSAGDDESSVIDPYNVGASGVRGYPANVDPGFDVWVLRADLQEIGAGGALAGAQLRITSSGTGQGFGVNDGGIPVTTATEQPILAAWDGIDTATVLGVNAGTVRGTGELYARIGHRLRRGNRLTFDSTSGAAATYRCVMQIGLFPEALGQDAST